MLTDNDFKNAVYFKHADYLKDAGRALCQFARLDYGVKQPRAVLYTNNELRCFKTALWIALENEHELAGSFAGYKGLWLVELTNHKVFVYGCRQKFYAKSIGGRVIHQLDILNSDADWIAILARHNSLSQVNIAEALSDQKRLELADSLYKVEHKLLHQVIQAFIAQLDTQTLQVLQAEGSGDNSSYNHYAAGSPEQQRNRIQAAKSYPWFSQALRQNWMLKRSVDQAEPLATELGRIYNIRPRTLRHFQREPHYAVSEADKSALTKLVDAYSADYFPRTKADQDVFLQLAKPLLGLADLLHLEPLQFAKPFSKGWKKGLDSLEQYLDAPLDLVLIIDMMQASFYYGVLPLLSSHKDLRHITRAPLSWYVKWFAIYGLKSLLTMANEWRLNRDEISIALFLEKNTSQELCWQPLLASVYQKSAYQIIELTSQQALQSEGDTLEHCVASYCVRCLTYASSIYSLRNCLGKLLSTFEIQFIDGQVKLLQHYAHKGARPCAEEILLVGQFIKQLVKKVPVEKILRVEKDKQLLGQKILSQLQDPASVNQPRLEQSMLAQLQARVKFTHPATMNTQKIRAYFLQNYRQH